MFSAYEMLIIGLITALSAVPAVMISMWFAIKFQLKKQLSYLPQYLSDPVVKVAVKESISQALKLTDGEFSEHLSQIIIKEMKDDLKKSILKVVEQRLDDAGKKLSVSLAGSLGAFVKNLKQEFVGAGKKKGKAGLFPELFNVINDLRGMAGKPGSLDGSAHRINAMGGD